MKEKKSWGYLVLYWWIRIFGPILYQIEIKNPHNIPLTGPVILAANHQSLLDPLLIGLKTPRFVRYLSSMVAARVPIAGVFVRQAGVIMLPEDGSVLSSVRTCVQLLEKDACICIFPEGWRTFNGIIQKSQPGIGLIARKTHAPIIPVRLLGNENPIFRGSLWMFWPHKITVIVGEPLDIDPSAKPQEIADIVMEKIRSLAPEPEKPFENHAPIRPLWHLP